MSYLVAIVLGFVEGATEFIPVSSSGHLIIVRQLLGENNLGGLAFDAVLQLSASCALLVYFWSDVKSVLSTFFKLLSRQEVLPQDRTMFWSVALGTIPAILFGLLLENYMDSVFRNVLLVALTLVLGSVLFWFAEKFSKQNKELSLGRGIMVGFFQCLALVPGISRSGATISGGLLSGLAKDQAVRFSFVLSLPILFGAGLKKLFEVRHDLLSDGYGLSLLLGSVVAFTVGLMSINFLIKYLKNHSLSLFIWYRVILATILLLAFR